MIESSVTSVTVRSSSNQFLVLMTRLEGTTIIRAQRCWHGLNLWLMHGCATILIKMISSGRQVAGRGTTLTHPRNCIFLIPKRADMRPSFAWGEIYSMLSSTSKILKRPLSCLTILANRPVRIQAKMCKFGQDVCGSRKAMIDSSVLSAAVEKDVESWAAPLVGHLIVKINWALRQLSSRNLLYNFSQVCESTVMLHIMTPSHCECLTKNCLVKMQLSIPLSKCRGIDITFWALGELLLPSSCTKKHSSLLSLGLGGSMLAREM
jgi:hypothetical protein